MKKVYLSLLVLVIGLIIVAAVAQFGAVCTWYLFASQASPVLVLLQVAALGAVAGGLGVLWWKAPKGDEMDEDMDDTPADTGDSSDSSEG